ncbi:MAG TPA: hypothetical protein VJM09_06920 [Sphingobium sp.]|nr:hypothetical protein [Sphingobium sp.]
MSNAHTPEFCRAQAAEHRVRADSASLPNVRTVALAAAATWLREAELAELVAKRRARHAAAG